MASRGIREQVRRWWIRAQLDARVLVRRCVPMSLVPALVSFRSWIGRRKQGRRELALESMRFVVGDRVCSAELEALAVRYSLLAAWRSETRWRPSLVNAQPVVGLEHLDRALALGKGCLLTYCHHGDYMGAFASLGHAGYANVGLGASFLFDSTAELWKQQHGRAFLSEKATAADVSIGSAGVRQLLREEKTVSIAIDFPGNTPTRMFGRDLLLSSGGTRIAYELDVPVIALTSRRTGDGLVGGAEVVLSSAFRPREFTGPEQLHEQLIRHFEASILDWPEALEEPLRIGKRHLVKQPSEYRVAAEQQVDPQSGTAPLPAEG